MVVKRVPFGHRQVAFLPFIDESEKKYRHVDAAIVMNGAVSAPLALAFARKTNFSRSARTRHQISRQRIFRERGSDRHEFVLTQTRVLRLTLKCRRKEDTVHHDAD